MQTTAILYILGTLGILGVLYFSSNLDKKNEEKKVTLFKATVDRNGERYSLETQSRKDMDNWIKEKENDDFLLVKYEEIE